MNKIDKRLEEWKNIHKMIDIFLWSYIFLLSFSIVSFVFGVGVLVYGLINFNFIAIIIGLLLIIIPFLLRKQTDLRLKLYNYCTHLKDLNLEERNDERI